MLCTKASRLTFDIKVNAQLFRHRYRGKARGPLVPGPIHIFLKDILDNTTDDNDDLLTVNEINLFILMYADDAAFFSKSVQTLQNMLYKFHDYSNEWGLKANTDKNKIMILEKGRETDVCTFIMIT